MNRTVRAYRGMVTAPHHLASEAGLRVLREGGNAIEAMIAAAATIAVVYPHMNGLGGDNFWLIHEPGNNPRGIDACGGAAEKATIEFYRENGLRSFPDRGPLAALTVAGAVAGWQTALEFSRKAWGGRLPLARLLEDAIQYAENGISVTSSQAQNTQSKYDELADVSGFASLFLQDGEIPDTGTRFVNKPLGQTLRRLAATGLEDFYRGDIGQSLARDLEQAGSPLSLSDLNRHHTLEVVPLQASIGKHSVFNMPPPTQGLASLILLGVFDQLAVQEAENFEFVHGLVEATKSAFRIRDRVITDPDYISEDITNYLQPETFRKLARGIDPKIAAPWPGKESAGDTVWLAAADGEGRVVSFIQSLYWEFGSGLVLPETGIVWQNRGISFSLDENHHNCLKPRRRPFHTIQPALAHLDNGAVLAYGTMGGEGQPQTQAMIFNRYVNYGQSVGQAIAAPRWLLGRTWGKATVKLRIEDRFPEALCRALENAGHDLEVVGAFDEIMGHAGAIVAHGNGLLEGASDPRSDGAAHSF
ncbi:MAG: gamma-glutamyltransferase family protein [Rhizobiaceae bacterium]